MVDSSKIIFTSPHHEFSTVSPTILQSSAYFIFFRYSLVNRAGENNKMFIKLFVLQIIFGILNETSSDCGCSKTSREERVKNDERIENTDYAKKTSVLNHAKDFDKMSLIPGGKYFVGTNEVVFESDGEGPQREVEVEKFYLDKYEVSNGDFKEFAEKSGYKTEAEIFGDSFIFKILINQETQKEYEDFRVLQAPWWYKVKDVSWKQPEGPEGQNIEERLNHPVVHVSWNDAFAFCKWKNKRLPSENEWEAACSGGRKGKLFPWGNKLMPKDQHWMNIWQGEFPDTNTAEDGYISTCPVDKYRQNDFDLYNIIGNAWEWTSDLWIESQSNKENPDRVKKGGSYLCHKSYCYRYRCAARSQNSQDSSAGNLSFRCAKNFE